MLDLRDVRDLWFIDVPEHFAQALGTKLQEDLEGLREDILNLEHGHPMFVELPPV